MSVPPPFLRLRYRLDGEERVVDLAGSEVTLGRGLDNRVVLPDPSVSRSHAAIRPEAGVWEVRDLGSTNGITLNGRQVASAPLSPGDVLRVGAVEMVVESGSGTARPAAEEEPEDDLLNATIVRRLEDLPGFGDTGALKAGKRRALEAAYSNEVFGHLTRLAGGLLTTDSLEQVLREVLDAAFDALPVDRGFIFLGPTGDPQEDTGRDRVGSLACELARHGDRVEVRPELDVPVSRTLLRAVVDRGVSLVTPDALEDRRLDDARSLVLHRVRSALAAPLWSGRRIVGVLLLDSTSRPGEFTEQDVVLATALANFAAIAIERIRYAERVEHERSLRARLERYHSPAVIGEVLSRTRSGRLEPKEAEVTVLFADLVGFSGFAEAAPPEEVAALLDRFFDRSVEAIFEHGGTLDKYIGDCVMAFFGAPVAQEDHARRALLAARSIRDGVAAWNRERQGEGGAPLAVRVALNSGPVVVGEVGGERRVEYTVLGNTVNVAARLEQYAAEPGDVVFSEATRAAAEAAGGHFPARSLGPLPLAGLQIPVTVWCLAGGDSRDGEE